MKTFYKYITKKNKEMDLTIPIFPLKIVVFPFSRYPLHIFEERYKRMLAKCRAKNTGFGVVAKLGADLSSVGTYSTITEIIRQYPTGETDIIVQGNYRFKTIELRIHPDGYYEADVDIYNDLTDGFNSGLLEELRGKFEELLLKTNYKLEDGYWENYYKTDLKSYKLAEKSGLLLEQQQGLLLLRDENERLLYLIKHFEMLSEAISESTVVKNMVLGDGYIN